MNAEFAQAYNDFSAAVKLDPDFTVALAFLTNLTTGETQKMYAKKTLASAGNKTDGEKLFTVDLTDGHFECNTIPFTVYDKQIGDPELTEYRLIFFRKHTHQINQGDGKEIAHEVAYRFGWQANDKDGKNVQRIIEIM